MTSPNSYGSTAGVANLVPRWAGTAGDFTPATRPTIVYVESLIDSVSAMLNAMLAEAGFTVPVTAQTAVLVLDLFVNEEVAAICDGINGSGRFGPTTKNGGGKGRFALLLDDVKNFVTGQAVGFERLGAVRAYSITSGIGYRSTDERGNAVAPIFQRDAFANVFQDWDHA
ncbi:MAG: hypothetical protein IT318_23785 [Anaerolineales bacterium]|nr:hypothetical protein [Anaerolineales bacterium]